MHSIQLVGLPWDLGLCGSHKHVVQPVVRLCIRPDEDGLPTPLVTVTGEALVQQVFPNVMAILNMCLFQHDMCICSK